MKPRLFGYDPVPVANAIDAMFGYSYEVLKKFDAVLGSSLVVECRPFIEARFPDGPPPSADES